MYGEISLQEAKKALKENPGIRIIDVRTAEEYRRGHISGAFNVPLDNIEEIAKLIPSKSAAVFIYCKSGMRSGKAKDILESMGYTDVHNMGGIFGWPLTRFDSFDSLDAYLKD